VLIERDNNIPAFPILAREAEGAACVIAEATPPARAAKAQ
jgi:hypothetical protein